MKTQNFTPNYTDEEQKTWCKYFASIEQYWQKYHKSISPIYLDHVEKLVSFRHEIPSFEALNNILRPIDWRVTYVAGYIPSWEFSQMLSEKILPLSSKIRTSSNIFFANEPDLIHDIFGHIPAMFNPEYLALQEKWAALAAQIEVSPIDRFRYQLNTLTINEAGKGKKSKRYHELKTVKKRLEKFNRAHPSASIVFSQLYFWIFEFGLIKMPHTLEIIGAGIMSSMDEIEKISTQDILASNISLQSIADHYSVSEVQQSYLSADGLAQYEKLLLSAENRFFVKDKNNQLVSRPIENKKVIDNFFSQNFIDNDDI